MSYYCKGSIYTDIQINSVNRNWEGGATMPFFPNVVTQMYIICSCLSLRELVDSATAILHPDCAQNLKLLTYSAQ